MLNVLSHKKVLSKYEKLKLYRFQLNYLKFFQNWLKKIKGHTVFRTHSNITFKFTFAPLEKESLTSCERINLFRDKNTAYLCPEIFWMLFAIEKPRRMIFTLCGFLSIPSFPLRNMLFAPLPNNLSIHKYKIWTSTILILFFLWPLFCFSLLLHCPSISKSEFFKLFFSLLPLYFWPVWWM